MDTKEEIHVFETDISPKNIESAERVLIDNGVDPDEAATVLQAIGYTLLDIELYPEEC